MRNDIRRLDFLWFIGDQQLGRRKVTIVQLVLDYVIRTIYELILLVVDRVLKIDQILHLLHLLLLLLPGWRL